MDGYIGVTTPRGGVLHTRAGVGGRTSIFWVGQRGIDLTRFDCKMHSGAA